MEVEMKRYSSEFKQEAVKQNLERDIFKKATAYFAKESH